MCGIVGIIEKSGRAAELSRVRRMTECIAYRGPDDEGHLMAGPVGLGHRRLSIVDVSAHGHQPMSTPGERSWIVFNGEIYNHAALRTRLASTAPFQSSSDTEVLVRAFEERGTACLRDLNGIFAFAVLDSAGSQLTLARDQFGIKPLYFAEDADRFYFGSEFKSIAAAGFRPVFNQLAAIDFCFSGWTEDRSTFMRGVRRLPPGSYLRYDLRTHTYTVERYYRPEPNWERADALGRGEENWVRAVDASVVGAVESQLMSDVPVGTFCSGGVDSSLITAIAARRHKSILAFNVSCPDFPELDEGKFADRVASHVGVKLHTLNLTRRSFREALVHTVYVTEYPLSFLNTVPLYLLSKLAREHGVKVLLSGEGADELFGGYVGQMLPKVLAQVVSSKGGRVGRAALRAAIGITEKVGSKVGMISPTAGTGMHSALTGGLRLPRIINESKRLYERYSDPEAREVAAELLTQLQTYLLPILHRTDRSTMAASVEARVPFLDPDLVDLALVVPPSLKFGRDGIRPVGKHILKRVAESYLPSDIVHRRKMGFAIPPTFYLSGWPDSWMRDGFIVSEFNLDPSEFAAWVGAQNGQSACWMLTMEMWGQMFVRGRSPEAVAEEFLAVPEA